MKRNAAPVLCPALCQIMPQPPDTAAHIKPAALPPAAAIFSHHPGGASPLYGLCGVIDACVSLSANAAGRYFARFYVRSCHSLRAWPHISRPPYRLQARLSHSIPPAILKPLHTIYNLSTKTADKTP